MGKPTSASQSLALSAWPTAAVQVFRQFVVVSYLAAAFAAAAAEALAETRRACNGRSSPTVAVGGIKEDKEGWTERRVNHSPALSEWTHLKGRG